MVKKNPEKILKYFELHENKNTTYFGMQRKQGLYGNL